MRQGQKGDSLTRYAIQFFQTRSRLYAFLGLVVILLATLAAYWPALWGDRIWDDDAHITPSELQSVNGLYRIWFDLSATPQYYPLLCTAFWVEHRLWGDSVLGYHIVNVLLHSISVTLLYFILRRLKVPGGLLAAAIFALHPVMVESVAWISEQKNTLSAGFYLSAMLVYLGFDESRKRSRFAIALVLFCLGLMAKTVTATLPAALLVIFWWQRGQISWKQDVLPLLPFFILAAIAGSFTAWFEQSVVGANGPEFELSFLQRGLLAGRVIWFYLSKLIWPAQLVFVYPRWEIDPKIWWQWLFPAATIGMLAVLWSLRHIARGPLAAWLLFTGTLLPVLGFLNVYPFLFSYVADHFQYIASIAMFVLAAAGITIAIKRSPHALRLALIGACGLWLATLATLTWRQSEMYADKITLYQRTLEKNPACWMAHNNLASELFKRGENEEAIAHYRESIRSKSNYTAYSNIGFILVETGHYQDAIAEINTALAIDPNGFDAHNNLGNAYFRLGRFQEAEAQYRRAIELDSKSFEAYYNLGLILLRERKFAESIEQLTHAVRLQPNDPDGHNSLGSAYEGSGQLKQAIDEYRTVLTSKPDYAIALYNLGSTLFRSGQSNDAIAPLKRAIQLNPGFLEAYGVLVRSLAIANKSQEAIATAKNGIEAAKLAGNSTAADELETWLRHYQIEINRIEDDAKRPGQN